MNRLALISLAFGGLVLTAGALVAGMSSPIDAQGQAQMTLSGEQEGLLTVTLSVENMYCAACPMMVRRTLEDVDGVSAAEVSYRDKTAVVIFDPAKCSAEQLTTATARLGYPSMIVE